LEKDDYAKDQHGGKKHQEDDEEDFMAVDDEGTSDF
jgi:hypothetical protein